MAIKWKEKYDAVVVDCHHSLHLCGGNENESPKKKKKEFFIFFRETPASPWVPFRAKFPPLGLLFRPSRPLAYSLRGLLILQYFFHIFQYSGGSLLFSFDR